MHEAASLKQLWLHTPWPNLVPQRCTAFDIYQNPDRCTLRTTRNDRRHQQATRPPETRYALTAATANLRTGSANEFVQARLLSLQIVRDFVGYTARAWPTVMYRFLVLVTGGVLWLLSRHSPVVKSWSLQKCHLSQADFVRVKVTFIMCMNASSG